MNARIPERYATALYLAPIVVAILDLLLVHQDLSARDSVAALIGLAALFARRRYPLAAFVIAFPAGFASLIIPGIALYSVGRYGRSGITVVFCTLVFSGILLAAHYPIDWERPVGWQAETRWFISDFLFNAILASAPAAFGRLISSRIALQDNIVELTRAHEEGDAPRIQTALARDRAELSSEMHDVVSHQVSLIAVRAGVLEMTSADPEAADAAATIRQLSVKTLDELRHMVTVLRASGTTATALAPQPTVADLPQLLRDSDLPVTTAGALPGGLDAATQRAIYRTVQEALTNIRKHAPGAEVTVELGADAADVIVTVLNTPASRPRMALPSAGHGLRGLTERAELLNGSLIARPEPDGGFRVELRLPIAADPLT
ncbi:sensor histidine kinase [Nocardia crassostreae]|uniref:sensor histidine kinase n=1 Tax=Nocardia crassostreae TaxID=53428 RepID=UPI00082AD943|nr:sensor histidine kinase [Nocardia crassostreae]